MTLLRAQRQDSLGFILFAAILLAVLRNASTVLSEADLFWHLKTGLDILNTGHLPTVDAYSWTHQGEPWIAKEWLSQVLYALAYRGAGWAGVLVLASFAVALAGWLMFKDFLRDIEPLPAAVAVLFAFVMIQIILTARPHLLTLPLVVLLTASLFKAARDDTPPPYWNLVLIMVWANLHASFTMAFVIAGFAFLEMAERTRLKNRQLVLRWIVFLALCLIAAVLTPYGAQPLMISINTMGGLEVMSWITEWQSFTPSNHPIPELGLMAVLILLLASRASVSWARIAFILFALHLLFSHVRFLYVFFLCVPIVVMADVAKAVPNLHWPNDDARPFSAATTTAILAAITAFTLVISMTLNIAPPEGTSISKPLAFVKQNQATHQALKGHVLNDYNFGGPLILDNIKTYVDGRAEQIFQGDFMTAYIASRNQNDDEGFKKLIVDRSITWTLLERGDVHNDLLAASPEWQKAYQDDKAVIFERK